MDFQVNRIEFRDALGKAMRGLPRGRTTLEVLENVLIGTLSSNGIQMKCTNLETQVCSNCKAKVTAREKGLTMLVNAKKLDKFVKASGADTLTAESVNGGVQLQSGRLKLTIPAYNEEDWPEMMAPEGEAFKISGLAGAISRVEYAISKEESRPFLASFHIERLNGKSKIMAADGFQYARTLLKLKLPDNVAGFNMPSRTGLLAKELFGNDPLTLSLEYHPGNEQARGVKKLSFCNKNVTLLSVASDGTFPDAEGSCGLMNKFPIGMNVNPYVALDACLQITKLVDSNIMGIKPIKNGLIFSIKDGDDIAEYSIPGKGKAVSVDVNYFANMLRRLKEISPTGAKLTYSSGNTASPIIYRDKTNVMALMPIIPGPAA